MDGGEAHVPPRPEDRPAVPKRPQTAGAAGCRYVKPDIMSLGEAAVEIFDDVTGTGKITRCIVWEILFVDVMYFEM